MSDNFVNTVKLVMGGQVSGNDKGTVPKRVKCI